MKVTKEMIDAFKRAVWVDLNGRVELMDTEIQLGIEAMLDHLFPEPGTNPLAQCAPDRDTVELNKLRSVLYQADQSELVLRTNPVVMRLAAPDPEREEILRTITSVRQLLQPWARNGWHSVNGDGR